MVDHIEARKLALSLPETTEQAHHGFPSFRVRDKIFATLPDPATLHVMLEAEQIREAVAARPDCCEEKWWGNRLMALRVRLAGVEAGTLQDWLTAAWKRRAPAALRRELAS